MGEGGGSGALVVPIRIKITFDYWSKKSGKCLTLWRVLKGKIDFCGEGGEGIYHHHRVIS